MRPGEKDWTGLEKDWREVNSVEDLPRRPLGWFKPPWYFFQK